MDLTPDKMDGNRVLSITNQMRYDAWNFDKDCAQLLRHYNGGALDVQDDQVNGNPRQSRANLLLGHKFLSRPIEQLTATYDDGLGFIEAKVHNPALQPSRRVIVEQVLNRCLNETVQKSERLYWPYRANVQDAVIYGIGMLYRDDPYDWAPKYGRAYFPWNAPADITDDRFTDWCFLGSLNLTEIIAKLDRAKKAKDADAPLHWDAKALGTIAETIAKRHAGNGNMTVWQPINYDNPIAWQEWVQTQSWGASALATACPVVWYFCKRFDKGEDKRPIDIYCVSRWGETQTVTGNQLKYNAPQNENGTPTPPYGNNLFHHECIFEDIRECFFPFQLSCMMGGEPLMRRVMGLGFLMYDLDIRIQTSIANMFDAMDFDFSPLFQATDSQSEMELQELSGTAIRPYDVLPTGAKFMEKPKSGRPYNSVLELVGLLSNEMGSQAQAFHGGGEFENKGRAELEVQVLERQQQLVTALRLRMGDFIRRGDPLATAIGEVIVNKDDLIDCDMAWPQREALKTLLEENGVEWSEVHGHARFGMRRPPGHGDPTVALRRAQQTEVLARGISPQAHQIALRNLVAAVNGNDMELALQLVPEDRQDDGWQAQQAMLQCASCLTTLMPAPVLPTDNPMAHVPVEFQVVQNQYSLAAQQQKWTVQQQRGFEALVAHLAADLRQLGAFNPDLARKVQREIDGMVRRAASFEVVQLQPQIDPVDAAKLQLGQAKLQLTAQQQQIKADQWERSQAHREQSAGFQENLQLAQLVNAEQNDKVNNATKLATTVHGLAQNPQAPTPEG